jgi:DHA1 family inner membrane transport protein
MNDMTPGHPVDEMSKQPPTTTAWFAVGVVVASGIVAALQVGKVAIAIPALRADLGLNLAAAGWVMAIFSVLGAVGGIPAGATVNRFGDRKLLMLGLLTVAVGSAAGAFAGGYWGLLGSRVIEGLGFVLIIVAGPALLQRIVAAHHQGVVFGMWSAYMPTGMAPWPC